MTDHKKLTADDARALLSDHIEGSLDEPTRAEVEALLLEDAALASEHRRLRHTLALLGTLEDPSPPSNVVGKVRDRLAAERRASAAGNQQDLIPHMGAPAPAWRRWGGIEAAIGLAAAASIAVFIAVVGDPRGAGAGGPSGTNAAGMAAEAAAVTTTIVAPGMPRYVVYEQAVRAGMSTVVGDTYEGDRRAAARFLMNLKEIAAAQGVEISGFVPDAERVRIEVRGE
jgi:anti-sigma factor RsiW